MKLSKRVCWSCRLNGNKNDRVKFDQRWDEEGVVTCSDDKMFVLFFLVENGKLARTYNGMWLAGDPPENWKCPMEVEHLVDCQEIKP